ncbi:MAG TPA: hypothetical protein VMP01_04585 [Pirellulaceae bacterium]|nr:hypothetical protein [Pirellulaceae bacterium]
MVRRILIVAFLLLLVVGGLIWFAYHAAEEAFQRDADVVRLRHLEHYGTLIEEYHAKTGHLPFQGNARVPIYVHVANDQQAEYSQNGPPTPHEFISVAGFISELEAGLGRPIKERYDPQFQPVDKPNFYVYMVKDDYYFFAVHLH